MIEPGPAGGGHRRGGRRLTLRTGDGHLAQPRLAVQRVQLGVAANERRPFVGRVGGGAADERHGDTPPAGFHGDHEPQVVVGLRPAQHPRSRERRNREQMPALVVNQQFELVRLVEIDDLEVVVPHQLDGELVIAVDWKLVAHCVAAAGAVRQFFEPLVLSSEIGRHDIRFRNRPRVHLAERQPADAVRH